MHRVYCSSKDILDNKIIVADKGEIHHLKDVLRLKLNDEIVVFDGQGSEYVCIIQELQKDKVVLGMQKKRDFSPEKDILITVACAIPKKSKMDDVVDKLTQLGVERIAPLLTKRVIIKLDKNKEISRLRRWQKIALSAAKQSQRKNLPIIGPIKGVEEFLRENSWEFELKLIPTLGGSQRKSLQEIFRHTCPKTVLILIGPEGDFTAGEVDFAKRLGCIPVSLGDLVLRVETAAVAIVSFIKLKAYL